MRRAKVLNGGSHCYAGDCGGSQCAVYSCGIYQGWYEPYNEVFTAEDYKNQIIKLAAVILNNNPEEILSEYKNFLCQRDIDKTKVKWAISACRDVKLMQEFIDFCEQSYPGDFDDYVKIAKDSKMRLQGLPENTENPENLPSQQELFETAKQYNNIEAAEDALLQITDEKLLKTLAGGQWDYSGQYYKNKIIRLAKTVLNYTPEEYAERYLYLRYRSGGKDDPDFSTSPVAVEWAVNNANREFLEALASVTYYKDFRQLAIERLKEFEDVPKNGANFKRHQRNLFHRAKNYMNTNDAEQAVVRIKDIEMLKILAQGEW